MTIQIWWTMHWNYRNNEKQMFVVLSLIGKPNNLQQYEQYQWNRLEINENKLCLGSKIGSTCSTNH